MSTNNVLQNIFRCDKHIRPKESLASSYFSQRESQVSTKHNKKGAMWSPQNTKKEKQFSVLGTKIVDKSFCSVHVKLSQFKIGILGGWSVGCIYGVKCRITCHREKIKSSPTYFHIVHTCCYCVSTGGIFSLSPYFLNVQNKSILAWNRTHLRSTELFFGAEKNVSWCVPGMFYAIIIFFSGGMKKTTSVIIFLEHGTLFDDHHDGRMMIIKKI